VKVVMQKKISALRVVGVGQRACSAASKAESAAENQNERKNRNGE
jgi:hypothetical protein